MFIDKTRLKIRSWFQECFIKMREKDVLHPLKGLWKLRMVVVIINPVHTNKEKQIKLSKLTI